MPIQTQTTLINDQSVEADFDQEQPPPVIEFKKRKHRRIPSTLSGQTSATLINDQTTEPDIENVNKFTVKSNLGSPRSNQEDFEIKSDVGEVSKI